MRWLWLVCVFLLVLLAFSAPGPAMSVPDPGEPGPYPMGSFSARTTNPDSGNTLETVIYYPASDGAVDLSGAPYPAIVFAHGFMASPSSYPGNAEHLASWGYIVALPDLPDNDTEIRQSDARHILSYLAAANDDPSSPLYSAVDAAHFGVTGHSLGGVTAMIAAARDPRVRAAVALDPTNPDPIIGADPWDYAAEAPDTTAPMLVLGAPSQLCNANANYHPMFDCVGSAHRAKLVFAEGTHCDFMVTDNDLHIFGCTLLCGGSYDEPRVRLIQRYATAWFNYYLREQPGYYAYLFGPEAEADVSAGRIVERDARTSVRGVAAEPEGEDILLTWTPGDEAVVVGYNVYRRTESGGYAGQPHAQVGGVASYLDTSVQPGRRYYYVVRSRDADGNEHDPSAEVSAVPEPGAPPTIEPPDATPTIEPPDATPTAEPPGTTPTAGPPGVTPTPSESPTPTDGARAYLPLVSR